MMHPQIEDPKKMFHAVNISKPGTHIILVISSWQKIVSKLAAPQSVTTFCR